MAKTVNRYPSINDINYKKLNTNYFVHSQFKGKQDNKNDALIDPNTFADCKNIYIDTNENLVSRAPFKINTDKIFLVDEEYVNGIKCSVYKFFRSSFNTTMYTFGDGFGTPRYNIFIYIEGCPEFLHLNLDILLPDNIRYTSKLDIKFTCIESYILIWVAGLDLFVYDVKNKLFKNAKDLIYKPIKSLVVNGVESNQEDRNYLSDVYIKRYLYSKDSYINFAELMDKTVKVYLDNGIVKYIYDININNYTTNRFMIAPLYRFSNITVIDFKNTGRVDLLLFTDINGNYYIAIDYNKVIPVPNLSLVDNDRAVVNMFISKDNLHVCALVYYTPARTGLNYIQESFYLYYVTLDEIGNIDKEWTNLYHNKYYIKSDNFSIFGIPKCVVKDPDNYAIYYPSNRTDTTYTMTEYIKCIYKDNTNYEVEDKFSIPIDSYMGDSIYECEFFYNNTAKPSTTQVYVPYISLKRQIVKRGEIELLGYAARGNFLQNNNYYASFYIGSMTFDTPSSISHVYTNITSYFDRDTELPVSKYNIYNNAILNITNEYESTYNSYIIMRTKLNDAYNITCITTGLTFEVSNFYSTRTFILRIEYNTSFKIPIESNNCIINYTDLPKDTNVTRLETLIHNKLITYNESTHLTQTNIFGGTTIDDEYFPVYLNNDKIIIYKNNYIYTSQLQDNIKIYIDVEEGSSYNLIPPDYTAPLNEDYYVFNNNIEVTEKKYDLISQSEGNDVFLLYFPISNEQFFVEKITALHPISDSVLGIFTEESIWYMSSVIENNKTLYYKPTKTKIPVGLKENNVVITMLNGQAILFPTPRGITMMSPQDFVATTDMHLQYISDNIQTTYEDFYEDTFDAFADCLKKSNAGRNDLYIKTVYPQIKIINYKYWIIFYKRLSIEMLWYDTRNNSWWKMYSKYPINNIIGKDRLEIYCKMTAIPKGAGGPYGEMIDKQGTLLPFENIKFLYCDKELDSLDYNDTILEYKNGVNNSIMFVNYNSKHINNNYIFEVPEKEIEWYFTSQKLNFNQPVNYKKILAMYMTNKGNDNVSIELSTKAYRDSYHPEKTLVMQERVNDIRTFVKRMNVMHVTDFQYEIKQDKSADIQKQFRLNSLTIKYEIKEVIR